MTQYKWDKRSKYISRLSTHTFGYLHNRIYILIRILIHPDVKFTAGMHAYRAHDTYRKTFHTQTKMNSKQNNSLFSEVADTVSNSRVYKLHKTQINLSRKIQTCRYVLALRSYITSNIFIERMRRRCCKKKCDPKQAYPLLNLSVEACHISTITKQNRQLVEISQKPKKQNY